jgi:hypothetical protein
VVGYTTFQASNGQMSSANIELEAPNQDALVGGANGQVTYSGTDATLSQALLHEIGHALGLADDSDQNSIMDYELTSSNKTLDSTDIAGIQALYGVSSSSMSNTLSSIQSSAVDSEQVDPRLNQLIAGMASFNPQAAGNISFAHDWQVDHHANLSASVQ